MTHSQIIWAVLIGAQAVLLLIFVASLYFERISVMTIDTRVQASLAEIAASMAALPGVLAAKEAAATAELAQATQDATDTATAVQASADQVRAAVGA